MARPVPCALPARLTLACRFCELLLASAHATTTASTKSTAIATARAVCGGFRPAMAAPRSRKRARTPRENDCLTVKIPILRAFPHTPLFRVCCVSCEPAALLVCRPTASMFSTFVRRAAEVSKSVASNATAVASAAAKRASASATAAIAAANLDRLQEDGDGSGAPDGSAGDAGAASSTSASGGAGGTSAGSGGGRGSGSTRSRAGSAAAGTDRRLGGAAGRVSSAYDDFDFTYITDRVIGTVGVVLPPAGSCTRAAGVTRRACGSPVLLACVCGTLRCPATGPLHRKPNSKLAPKFLQERHASHYMILNLSESSYDYAPYGDQVTRCAGR